MEKDELVRRLSSVGGWLYPGEAWALYNEAVAIRDRPAVIVEIGSWKGRSTIALASGASGPQDRVYAIDPHTGSREHGRVDTFAIFQENVHQAGVQDRVVPVRMRSHDAASLLELQAIDLLFIDGSHEYSDVRQDIQDWIPRLRPGGVVAFNDPSWPGVHRALFRHVLTPHSPLRNPVLVDNTLFFRYVDLPCSAAERQALYRARLLLGIRRLGWIIRPYMPRRAVRLTHRIFNNLIGDSTPRP